MGMSLMFKFLKPTIQFLAISFVFFNASTVFAQESIYQATRLNNGNPIITPSMFNNPSDGENINGPSLIRVPSWIPSSRRAHASAQYYLYFGHHVGDYIRMAWAANIEGPYTLYNNFTTPGNRGVLDNNEADINLRNNIRIEENHLASPDVIVDDENQRIVLYFHSGSSFFVNGDERRSQVSWVSTSPYGLNFNGRIEPVHLGSSYFRVFPYDGDLYALDNGARLNRALDANNPWAIPAGHDFTTALWDRNPNHVFQDDIPVPRSELRVRHTGVRVVGDTLHVFYSRRGEFQERIQLSTIDMTPSWTNWDPTYPPIDILTPNPGWEGGHLIIENSETSAGVNVNQLRDPDVFEDDDGQLYLIYSGNGEGGLGLARLYETPDTDQSIIAEADAHTRESSRTRNFGFLNNFRTSSDGTAQNNRTAYVKFDLSNISNVDHASVRLYSSATTGGPVTVYKASSNWTEGGINFSNAPALGDAITTTHILDDDSYYDWNITDYVQENLGSEITVAFDVATPNAASHNFGSVQTEQSPRLNISNSQPTVNVAIGKSTRQSSTLHGGSSGRAVDGNSNGFWGNRSVTHTAGGVGEWWYVDLGGNTTIQDINIFNRTDGCCVLRLGNFTVTVTNTVNGPAVWSRTVTTAPSPSIRLNVGGVTGRYVRISQNMNAPLSLSEVEVRAN